MTQTGPTRIAGLADLYIEATIFCEQVVHTVSNTLVNLGYAVRVLGCEI